MKRLLGISVGAGLVIIAASIVVPRIGSQRVERIPPTLDGLGLGPPEAEVGQPFRYDVGHCGLTHVVGFDGSYWDVDPTTLTDGENSRFGINSDSGIMTLVSPDVAIYRSLAGGEATLHRHAGSKEFPGCL